MHKDFHLYGTYLAARLAGRNETLSREIAYAAQATDDFTYGEYSSCQSLKSMAVTDMNIVKTYWSIFHFLPSGIGTPQVEERMYVTRPEGLLFNKLNREALDLTDSEDGYDIAYIGVLMHIIADTFAHKGFSGIPSRLNVVENVIMCDKQELNAVWSKNSHVPVMIANHVEKARIGHGTAGNAPDLSWITFTYIDPDCSDGFRKLRNNAVTFAEAFVTLYKLLGGNTENSGKIAEGVNNFLRAKRNSVDISKKESYFEDNDNCFADMLGQNTLNQAAGFAGRISKNEIKTLTDGYPAYINKVNELAKAFSSASNKDEKNAKFRDLSNNDFFAATVRAREAVMCEIDKGFKESTN